MFNVGMAGEQNLLQLHIEPTHSVDVRDFTSALGSISRQYQQYAQQSGLTQKSGDARLLISSLSQGSIDILFDPQIVGVGGMLLLPYIDQARAVKEFAEYLKWLLGLFHKGTDPTEVTVRDCDDAINIVKPIASGGTQSMNVIKGNVTQNILVVSTDDAREIMESAYRKKAALQFPEAETRKAVSLIWYKLARDEAKTDGTRSPDHGTIQEIDEKPHAVLFTDEMAPIKRAMIDDNANPYQNVYYVDVEVSRVNDKVTAYRVIGYHGKDDLS